MSRRTALFFYVCAIITGTVIGLAAAYIEDCESDERDVVEPGRFLLRRITHARGTA
jgi:hypothetical protein